MSLTSKDTEQCGCRSHGVATVGVAVLLNLFVFIYVGY